MRTKYPLMALFAIGLAGAFFTGSGFSSVVQGEAGTQKVSDVVNNSADGSVVDDDKPLSGSRETTGDGSIVGLVIGGGRIIGSIIGKIVLLPFTLMNLEFPVWFAVPVGAFSELIVSVGLIQFVTGRIWE